MAQANRQPLVSVITPTLNQASFIEATLVSVMRQTYPRVEHIVVDGGSTDGTLDILARYGNRYDLTWSSGPDSGMYEAINRGMIGAKGDILCYLNSDDLYLPWTIDTVVTHFNRNHHVDVVFGDALLLNERDRGVRLAFYPPFTRAFVLRAGSLLQPTVFWRHAAFQHVGPFDAELRFVGDLDYWIRLGRDCQFGKVDEFLAVERGHPDAKTSAFTPELLREAQQVRSRHEKLNSALIPLSRLIERVRGWLWRRYYWASFVREVRQPTRHARWSHFLSAARPRVSVARAALIQLPLLGWRFASDAVVPSPAWVDEMTGRDVR